MNIESHLKHGYRILTVKDPVVYSTDFSPLRAAVEGCLDQGEVNIALSFTADSYLSSTALGVLVGCIERVDEKGGTIALVGANESILGFLRTTSLDAKIKIVESEDGLAAQAKRL